MSAALSDALAEYAAACDSLRGEQEALIADLERRRFESIVEAADLLCDDADDLDRPVPFDRLRPGQFVKVAGEWPLLVGKRPGGVLVLSERGRPPFTYVAGDGEMFWTEEPLG